MKPSTFNLIEIVFGGQIQFVNFVVLDNEKSGIDLIEVKGPKGDY